MTCMCILHFGTSAKQQCEINKFKVYGQRVFSFLYLNLTMVTIDSLKLIFPCAIFAGISDVSAHQHFTKPLSIA